MDKFNWEEEREREEGKAITQHERLHKLFVENRFAFELEKKKLINEIIEGAGDEAQKQKLRAIQESWDRKMKKAGSEYNRFVLAQHFFWEHVNNIWNPFLQECSRELRNLVDKMG